MEFQYDLLWRENPDESAATADIAGALAAEPVVLINGAGADDPIVTRRLFHP